MSLLSKFLTRQQYRGSTDYFLLQHEIKEEHLINNERETNEILETDGEHKTNEENSTNKEHENIDRGSTDYFLLEHEIKEEHLTNNERETTGILETDGEHKKNEENSTNKEHKKNESFYKIDRGSSDYFLLEHEIKQEHLTNNERKTNENLETDGEHKTNEENSTNKENESFCKIGLYQHEETCRSPSIVTPHHEGLTSEPTYKTKLCNRCGETFESLKKHEKSCKGVFSNRPLLHCSRCQKVYKCTKYLLAHESRCRPHICLKCNKQFSLEKNRKRHSKLCGGIQQF